MTHRVLARVAVKGALLFVIANLLALLIEPVALLQRVSIYNALVPGRERLPWGERPELAYNLTLDNVDAMFASHALARPKAADEFRVVLIGDSSTWGFLLRPEDTLSALLNARRLTRDGRRVRVYNAGYPDFSLSKDAVLLHRVLRHEPDLIVWLVTLRSFPNDAQDHALVRAHPEALCAVMGTTCPPAPRAWHERTLIGQRRALADLIRLQLFGVSWAATGIDQHYPEAFEPTPRDLSADADFRGFKPPALPADALAFDVLERGIAASAHAGVPLVVVNEPILVSGGAHSDVRYNALYPRWAYDQYRALLAARMAGLGAPYLDLWDRVPEREFTNSAVHVTPAGSRVVAEELARVLSP